VQAPAAADAGFVYLIGGAADVEVAQVLHAAIQPDGALGDWQLNTGLPMPRRLHATAATAGFLYVIGGAGEVSDVFYTTRSQTRGSQSQPNLRAVKYAH
jgi:hypothetical protein